MAAEYNGYRLKYDLHTHTTFSHGKGSIEDNVKEAVKKGLTGIAITDHGPGHLTYGIKRSDVPVMRAEVERLKKVYPQIDIFLGVEANIVAWDNWLDVTKEEIPQYDFILAGYHYGVRHGYCIENYLYEHIKGGKTKNAAQSGSQSRSAKGGSLLARNTEMTVRAIYENPIKILTHPGDKGPFDIVEIAKACEARGTLMEINDRHGHMTEEELKAVAPLGVSFIISSDAHTVDRVGSCDKAIKRMLNAGIDPGRVINLQRR